MSEIKQVIRVSWRTERQKSLMNIRDFSRASLRRSLTCFQKKRKARSFVFLKTKSLILRKNFCFKNSPFGLKELFEYQSVHSLLTIDCFLIESHLMKVSIIITTYNRKGFVKRAIASVLYQDWKDYEVIVVDDGSTDGTRDALSIFGDRIRYISHPKNKGISSARNTGIKEARYPFIAFLDSDDYWLPRKISNQMLLFRENPEAVACQTQEIWIRKGKRVNPKKRHLKPSGDIFVPSLRLCLVSPSAVMLRKSIFEEVGLFDEELPVCEDYDLWLRISCRYPVYLIDKPLVIKEGGHKDQLSSRYRGMDRFRIYALMKLIKNEPLSPDQYNAVIKELEYKCRIYGNGCMKRGRIQEGKFYLNLPELAKKDPATPFLGLRHQLFLQGHS